MSTTVIVLKFFYDKLNSPVGHLVTIGRLTSVDVQGISNELKAIISTSKAQNERMCYQFALVQCRQLCQRVYQMKCKELNSSIVYVNLYAHCLNLFLVDACSVLSRNRIYRFRASRLTATKARDQTFPLRHAAKSTADVDRE